MRQEHAERDLYPLLLVTIESRQPCRKLAWTGCYNVRDLGGHPTSRGGRTRWRAVVRGDTPSRLSPAGRAALREYGVRTIVDLRMPREVAAGPSSFGLGPAYRNIPLFDDAGRDTDAIVAARSPVATYRLFLDCRAERIGEILRAVADAAPGVVLVHCQIGRDRTGIVAALLLSLAGVPPEVVADDYARSGPALAPLYSRWLEAAVDEEDRARLRRERECRRDTMLETLAYVDDRHGGVARYVAEAGLSQLTLVRLRARLVEPVQRRAAA